MSPIYRQVCQFLCNIDSKADWSRKGMQRNANQNKHPDNLTINICHLKFEDRRQNYFTLAISPYSDTDDQRVILSLLLAPNKIYNLQ